MVAYYNFQSKLVFIINWSSAAHHLISHNNEYEIENEKDDLKNTKTNDLEFVLERPNSILLPSMHQNVLWNENKWGFSIYLYSVDNGVCFSCVFILLVERGLYNSWETVI